METTDQASYITWKLGITETANYAFFLEAKGCQVILLDSQVTVAKEYRKLRILET